MTRIREKKASEERRFCLQRIIVAFVVNSYFWSGVWTDKVFVWNGIPVNLTDKGEYVVDTDSFFTSIYEDVKGRPRDYLPILEEWKKKDHDWETNKSKTISFAELKERIEDDFKLKFDGSAWFGGTSPFHKFQSKCFFALGSYRENACVFKDTGRSSKCAPTDDELCGESLLPGCWHGSARAKKEGTVSTSLTCNPLARNHYTPGMLPENKEARRKASVVVMNHVMITVKEVFEDMAKDNKYDPLLKKENVRRHSVDTNKPEIVAAIKELSAVKPDKTKINEGLKVLIPDVVHPKDAFWNIFADEKIKPRVGDPAVQMAKAKRTQHQGYIDLCTYFANALKESKRNVFPESGTLEEKIGKCFEDTKKKIPDLCIQNYAPAGSSKEEQDAYKNWTNFKEFIHKPEQHDVWKLFRFATQDSIHSKFKGCYCFTEECNSGGFEV